MFLFSTGAPRRDEKVSERELLRREASTSLYALGRKNQEPGEGGRRQVQVVEEGREGRNELAVVLNVTTCPK